MTLRGTRDVVSEIAAEEARLTRLKADEERSRRRLEALRAELSQVPAVGQLKEIPPQVPPDTSSVAAPKTTADKLALFRRLFRGRDDVFAKLWVSRKNGRRGYAPACSNEWVPGVCEKPRVKCGDCRNQAFVPLQERALLDHLLGRHVVGLYPLLVDETCWLLAVDFDKRSWVEDVGAFVETCRTFDLDPAVERSRSGNGAHVWFFFEAPIAADAARKMGCYLITESMTRRHELGMDSYDRLFPNQDTMPQGGFGNLIALPFQNGPRQEGNTVFVDGSMAPHHDQWAYLSGIQRLPVGTVKGLASEATRRGLVVGVRATRCDADEEDDSPWSVPPSGRVREEAIPGPLPESVQAVLSQRLFVAKAGLPSSLINRIKRLAAFQNPEFYKKQRMRLSTALTPRVVSCAEDLPRHVALPRGCLPEVDKLLASHGVRLSMDDQRVQGERVDFRFQGELTDIQTHAAAAVLEDETGVFVAPPGVGKTVVGTYLVAKRARSTLILVHRRPLLDQWKAQLSMFLGVSSSTIGQIGGGKRKPNGRLDVAMLQSLIREGHVEDVVADYGHVIVDECHHLPASSFERVLSEVKARYVTGLTATPHRRDGHHPIIHMQCGPVRFAVDPKSHAARRPFEHRVVVRETGFRPLNSEIDAGIQRLYQLIGFDEGRNSLLLDDIIASLEEGRSPIVLTERRDHLEYLAEKLGGFARHLIVLQGGMRPKERREVEAQLAAVPDGEERLLLATGRYLGEGFDDARLDTLFLAMPVSWKGTLTQYAGRLHRLHPGKTEVRIYDYVDRDVPMLAKMFDRRLRTYAAMGYESSESLADGVTRNEQVSLLSEPRGLR